MSPAHRLLPCTALLFAWFVSGALRAQDEDEGPFVVRDSGVGYIDSAIPGDQIRFRFDAGYEFARPSRGEFFYARTGPRGPGLPQAESNIDFQDLMLHVERRLAPFGSLAVEAPVRFLNPEVNENTAGLADMNVTVKAVLLEAEEVVSAQLRIYLPTGDADRGLSVSHMALEPALLLYQPLGGPWRMEGELRWRQPLGGTDFAGPILRYGVGVQRRTEWPAGYVAPVAELVGWTVLDGKKGVMTAPGVSIAASADGDTILNAKCGLRAGLSERCDGYFGYGRSISGDTWYEHILRAEVRMLY